MLKIIILAILSIGFASAADETPKLSKEAQAIIATAEKDVAKNRSAYDDANKKPLDVAEKALRQELDKLTKAGKLEEAMALKKAIEGFRADTVTKIDEKAKSGSDLLGEPKPDASTGMIGEWVKAGMKDHFILNADGSISWGQPVGWYKGTWKVEKRQVVFNWTEHSQWGTQSFSVSKDGNTLTGGDGWVLQRAK